MPRAEVSVSDVNLASDYANYYQGCILTYEGNPAYVREVYSHEGEVWASIKVLTQNASSWGNYLAVRFEELGINMPRLGMVRAGPSWFYLSRQPQRRMRKGYSLDLIKAEPVGDHSDSIDIMNTNTIRQVWFGNSDRVSHDIVVIKRSVYFEQDKVADVDEEGSLIILSGKEKLGEFVCKLLANNWENLSSKFSIRRLP